MNLQLCSTRVPARCHCFVRDGITRGGVSLETAKKSERSARMKDVRGKIGRHEGLPATAAVAFPPCSRKRWAASYTADMCLYLVPPEMVLNVASR